MTDPKAIEMYISYSHEDEEMENELERHLASLKRQGLITIWSDKQIQVGSDWRKESEAHLNTARLILLLISAHYLASDVAYSFEIQHAIKRHEEGVARVIPILLRNVDWHNTPFGQFQALPADGRPITSWADRDEAFFDIATNIRRVVQDLLAPQEPYPPSYSGPIQQDSDKSPLPTNSNATSEADTDPSSNIDKEVVFRQPDPASSQADGILAEKSEPTEKIPGNTHIDGTTLGTTPRRPVISGFTSDNPDGQDLLDIKKEVEALCSVLAAKDVEPPLSLGLFGDWGSGKSFFMYMMQVRIEALKEAAQQAKDETAYCKDIIQLKFNAWHYIDTDLWASLTSEIFEGLAMALAKKDDADSEYKRERLQANIIKSKAELAKAEQEKNKAHEQLQEREQRLKQLKQSYAETEAATETNLTPQAIIHGALRIAIQQPEISEKVEETKKLLNANVEAAAKALNYPTVDAMTTDLKTQLLELRGIGGRVRAFSIAIRNTRDRRAWLRLVPGTAFIVLLALVFILVLPFFHTTYLLDVLSSVLGLLLSFIVFLAPFMPGVRQALNFIRQARDESKKLGDQARKQKQEQFQSQRDKLQKEIASAQQQLKQAQQQLEQSRDEVRGNEQGMEDLRPDRQMSNFIKQRQASKVYTKHLGVIAQAREDFEKLSMLLAKEKAGTAMGTPASQDAPLLPRIDRIILYIDDLDRCPEKRVVDTLQAVHLLLAFPLFIVVVGVDSRWLMHSLKQRSRVFRSEVDQHDGVLDEDRAHWQSTPLNYLEKIFQIPFTLRPMQATGFEQLVDSLTSQQHSVHIESVKNEPPTDRHSAPPEDLPALTAHTPEAGEQPPRQAEPLTKTSTDSVNVPLTEHIDMDPEYLRIEDWERAVMKRLYHFIPSPRATKRFVNIYRLLRASIDDHKLQAFIGNENEGQHRPMLLLLAMLIGYPAETIEILRFLLEQEHTETWWNFIDSSIPALHSATNKTEAEHWRQLSEKLTAVRSLIREDLPCVDFVECAPQVARYSYQSRPIFFAQ